MIHKAHEDIHTRLLRVLAEHPDGISIDSIRLALGLHPEEHQHLDRRIRDLDPLYVLHRERRGRKTYYIFVGKRATPTDTRRVDKTTRARILHLAGSRCQMCGRSVAEDRVKLHIDHKIPRGWGGKTEDDNLWALCSSCNEGKRNFFASITDLRIQQSMLHKSVHVRMGELLKAFNGDCVPKKYIAMVASTTHDDFEKRLRELRELGWRFSAHRHTEEGRVRTCFSLEHWEPWPEDPAAAIREAEKLKKAEC